MSTIRFIYIVLHVFEIWMLFIAGRKMSRTNTDKGYWKASLLAFIPYAIVLGLRFGHNIDWNIYCENYMEHNTMDWTTTEPIFNFIFYVFHSIKMPYFIVICLQDIFFMFSFLLIAKYFRKCLYFVLPLLPVVAQSNDNYIRWYWAVSFVLISVYFLCSDSKMKLIKSIIFLIAGVSVHNGVVFFVLLIPAYYLLREKYLPPIVSSIAIFISVFFISIAIMSFLTDIAEVLYMYGGNTLQESKASTYLLKINDLTNSGLRITGIKEYGLRGKIITFISFFPVIIYGPRYLKNYKYGILFYNFFIIGAFFNPFFSTVEIFDRFSKTFLIFQAIVAGIVYYKMLKDVMLEKQLKILCVLSMFCCFYPFINYSFFIKAEYRMMYIWDANGRDKVDTNYYIIDILRNRN